MVEGDLVRLAPGDQVVADGRLASSDGLQLDESILTGESRPVPKSGGDEVRSGSFAVEGAGAYVVDAVGADSYAERLVGEVREFRHPRSPLERSIDRLLYILVAAMVPLGVMLITVLWKQDVGIRHAVNTAVAGMVTLVPEGLVLLVSVTYAAAALGLGRRGALAQQLNAIESLASVDTLCIDKTGTLTGQRAARARSRHRPTGSSPSGFATRSVATRRLRRPGTSRSGPRGGAAGTARGAARDGARSRRAGAGARCASATRRYVLGAPELFPSGALADDAATGRRPVAASSRSGRRPQPRRTIRRRPAAARAARSRGSRRGASARRRARRSRT